MPGHIRDGHDLAELVDTSGQASGDTLVGIEQFQVLHDDLPALATEDLAVGTPQVHLGRGEVEIVDRADLPLLDASGRPTSVTDRAEPSVRHHIDRRQVGLGGHAPPGNTDSMKGKVRCYTELAVDIGILLVL